MIDSMHLSGFTGIPYLASSSLMTAHEGKLRLSSKKVNVLVGPNGSGKSALLRTLALRFLAVLTGESLLSSRFTSQPDYAALWTKAEGWRADYEFMKGLNLKTDEGPVVYYRPNMIPGEEDSVTSAMMCGFFDEAKEFARATEQKSTGQANLATLERALAVATGQQAVEAPYPLHAWSAGREPRDLRQTRGWVGEMDYKAEALKPIAAKGQAGKPLVLMDEPEQSLDARAELAMWKRLESTDCAKAQVLVATHSLYPFLHPRRFNIIEATPGYVENVSALFK